MLKHCDRQLLVFFFLGIHAVIDFYGKWQQKVSDWRFVIEKGKKLKKKIGMLLGRSNQPGGASSGGCAGYLGSQKTIGTLFGRPNLRRGQC